MPCLRAYLDDMKSSSAPESASVMTGASGVALVTATVALVPATVESNIMLNPVPLVLERFNK